MYTLIQFWHWIYSSIIKIWKRNLLLVENLKQRKRICREKYVDLDIRFVHVTYLLLRVKISFLFHFTFVDYWNECPCALSHNAGQLCNKELLRRTGNLFTIIYVYNILRHILSSPVPLWRLATRVWMEDFSDAVLWLSSAIYQHALGLKKNMSPYFQLFM